MSLRRFVKQHGLQPLGRHHLFLDRNGRPVAIRENISRTRIRGEEFGDEFGEEFDGSVNLFTPNYLGDEGGDFVADDDFGTDMDYMADDFGRRGGRMMMSRGGGGGGLRRGGGGLRRIFHRGNRMPSQHSYSPAQQISVMEAPLEDSDMNQHVNIANRVPQGWCQTVIGNNAVATAAGQVQVQIRLQHDFLAQDITFEGSSAGATVSAIYFGDRLVWSQVVGLPVTIFAGTSFIRNLLIGQRLRAGLDINIVGALTGAGTFQVTLVGSKPYALAIAG